LALADISTFFDPPFITAEFHSAAPQDPRNMHAWMTTLLHQGATNTACGISLRIGLTISFSFSNTFYRLENNKLSSSSALLFDQLWQQDEVI